MQPPVKENDKGEEVPDFLNTEGYQFKNFYKRYGNIADVKRYRDEWTRKGAKKAAVKVTAETSEEETQRVTDEANRLYELMNQ